MVKESSSIAFYIILALILCLSVSQYNSINCLYTQKITLWSINSTNKFYSPTGYNFSFSWGQSMNTIVNLGIAFAGYQYMSSSNGMSFDAQLTNVTSYGGIIDFRPDVNSSIVYSDFVALLVGGDCNNNVDTINDKYLMPLAFSGPVNMYYNNILFHSNFIFSNPQDFIFVIQFTSIQSQINSSLSCYNCQLVNTYLQQLNIGTNTGNISFISTIYYPLISARVLITLFNKTSFLPSLSYTYLYADSSLPNFNINTNIFGLNYQHNCLIGLNYFWLQWANNNISYSYFIYYQLNGSLHSSRPIANNYLYSGICFKQCIQHFMVDYSINSSLCSPCVPSVQNCYVCSSPQNCTACMPMYFLLQPNLCKLCMNAFFNCHNCNLTQCTLCYLGDLVQGGCTLQAGCRVVQQIMPYTSDHLATCTACYSPEFSYQNGECICVTNIVTGVCIMVNGCIMATRINRLPICLGCHIELNFMLVNQTCVCIDGFVLSGLTCVEVCGDSRVFTSQCDDGNTVSGDGCTSTCTIESGFHCLGGSKTHESTCYYVLNDITLTVVDMDKIDFLNEGKFIFQITPAIGLFDKMNFSSLLHFNCNANFSFKSISYFNGLLQLIIPYSTDLENKMANLTIDLDPTLFVKQSSINLTFQIKSRGVLLIIQNMSQYHKEIALVFQIASFIMLGVFIVGIWFGKMISIEIANMYQMIFLTHVLTEYYSESLMVFRELTLSMLNFQYQMDKKSNVYLFNYNKISYEKDNNLISFAVLFGVIILAYLSIAASELIVKMITVEPKVQQYSSVLKKPVFSQFIEKGQTKEKLIQQLNVKHQKYCTFINFNKVKYFIYNRIIFVFTIGFFYLIVLTTNIVNIRELSPFNFIHSVYAPSVLMLLTFFSTAIIFFKEWRIIVKSELKAISFGVNRKKYLSKYVSAYLTYSFCMIMTLTIIYSSSISIGKEILLIISTIFVVWLAFYPPYMKICSNISVLLNQTLVALFIFWIILRDFVDSLRNEKVELIIMIVITSLMVICLGLTIFRILVIIYQSLFGKRKQLQDGQFKDILNKTKDNNTDLKQNQPLQKFKSINPFRLQTMIFKEKVQQLLAENRQREFDSNYPIYDKKDINQLKQKITKYQNKQLRTQLQKINSIESKNLKKIGA